MRPWHRNLRNCTGDSSERSEYRQERGRHTKELKLINTGAQQQRRASRATTTASKPCNNNGEQVLRVMNNLNLKANKQPYNTATGARQGAIWAQTEHR